MRGGAGLKAELKINSINQILKGTEIYAKGEQISSMCLVVKGRVRIHTEGVNIVVGSGNFLGICDLAHGKHQVTYEADTNSVVYAFAASDFSQTIRAVVKANKDYSVLMVSTLSKYIRELSNIYDSLHSVSDDLYNFITEGEKKYLEIAEEAGVKAAPAKALSSIDMYAGGEDIDINKVVYYRNCCEVPAEIQKSFFGYNTTIALYNVSEQIELINVLIKHCEGNAEYVKGLIKPLIKDDHSLYMGVWQLATTMQHMQEDTKEIMSLFDDVIDRVNSTENLLYEKCHIDLEIDHEFMEDAYFDLLNGSADSNVGDDMAEFALTEETQVSVEELDGALSYIVEYAELEDAVAAEFIQYIEEFAALPDKVSTEDDARAIRRGIAKIYYDLYKKVFLKDYRSSENTPLIIDLFLKYGFISEKLLTTELLEELLAIDDFDSGSGSCKVYNMKEWLTEIANGTKEPSKSEFDMDYEENLRDMRKTGRITEEQQRQLAVDRMAKLDYEINNMFKANHRLINGQISIFVPFLHTDGCTGSLQRLHLSKDRINGAVQRLLKIDYSAFYRERIFKEGEDRFQKEYIVEEVFPDVILFPALGGNGVMWQELSGRRRNSKGRFLLPYFLDTDLDSVMIKLFGRFRWELCRTMQGASWNNIQIKSLTSEYSDFIQFYRKNRELSDDKKDKLKMQIQKSRNNTREVFVIDYENWIKHEAQGGLTLSKPVREIMATYCPFRVSVRESMVEQPLFRDAMARFIRERGKKKKDYELKFKIWEKDGVKVPEEIIRTKEFYVDM